MSNKEQNTKPPQSDGTTCPVTDDRERVAALVRLEEWGRWSRNHNRDKYGRGDAFLAGAESEAAHWEVRVKRLVEALEKIRVMTLSQVRGDEEAGVFWDWKDEARKALADLERLAGGDK